MDRLENQLILPAPAWLLERLRECQRNGRAAPLAAKKIPKGTQHSTLVSIAGTMRNRGLEVNEIFAALKVINEERCTEPGPVKDIRQIAESICKYPAGKILPDGDSIAPPDSRPHQQPHAPEPGSISGPRREHITLFDTLQVFVKWLHLPNTDVVIITLGTVAANRIPGDPLWLMLIGPPASGKTEVLDSVIGLPHTYPTGTLTEASLLSGSPRRERMTDSSGGLLRRIGGFGYIVLKDFTSILGMNRETRGPLLAALREIHDGRWTRHVGVDGGRTLSWQGKVALIAACTPIIDQHHAVIATMGERFIACRMPEIKPVTQARQALRHTGKEDVMRKELLAAVCGLFQDFEVRTVESDSNTEMRLAVLSSLVVACRSAVERDPYRREIDLVPGTERPARLVLELERLRQGLKLIGVTDEACWRMLIRVGLDSIPAIRRRVFDTLRTMTAGSLSTKEVAQEIAYPSITTRRALEDLTAHGMVLRGSEGQGKADMWQLSERARTWYEVAKGEKKLDEEPAETAVEKVELEREEYES